MLMRENFFFFGRVGGVCAKCEVTQEGFCEQT